MAVKIRKQIYIEPDQNTSLQRLSVETGLPEAELIRQAIDRQITALRHPRRNLRTWDAERTFITQLIQQGPIVSERTWRREDLHER